VEEPDKRARLILEHVAIMRRAELPMSTISVGVGVPEATLWRWLRRERGGDLIVRGRGKRVQERPLSPDVIEHAKRLVHETRGLIGADAMRRISPELSRRRSARIKRTVLTERERERKLRAACITITQPGVIRAFDGVFVRTTRGLYVALIAGDGAVPFRTSVFVTAHYDEHAVALALMRDSLEALRRTGVAWPAASPTILWAARATEPRPSRLARRRWHTRPGGAPAGVREDD
jgi:hypothetical protein